MSHGPFSPSELYAQFRLDGYDCHMILSQSGLSEGVIRNVHRQSDRVLQILITGVVFSAGGFTQSGRCVVQVVSHYNGATDFHAWGYSLLDTQGRPISQDPIGIPHQ